MTLDPAEHAELIPEPRGRELDILDLPVHPAADLFPETSEEEHERLRESIRREGPLLPLVVHEDSEGRRTLLDGRHRRRACVDLGVRPRVEIVTGDPVAYVIAVNRERRHLTAGQLAILAVEAEPIYAADARRRMLAGKALDPGTDPSQGQLPQDRKSATRAAKALGVGSTAFKDAKKLLLEAPDLAERVRSGELRLNKAKALAGRTCNGTATPDDCYTPRWLFAPDQLDLLFDLDVCAPENPAHRNVPAKRYLTKADDGLSVPWEGLVWVNPPFSKPERWIAKWAEHPDGLMLVGFAGKNDKMLPFWAAAEALVNFSVMLFDRPNGNLWTPWPLIVLLGARGPRAVEALYRIRHEKASRVWVPGSDHPPGWETPG